MPTYIPPKINTAFVFAVGLVSQTSSHAFQANPTLAAGDVKVSIDNGALANLATLPTVTPAAGKIVKVSLSAAEMNGANIQVVFSDAAGAEWDDLIINIQTSTQQIDDLATQVSVNTIDDFVDTEVAAIKAKTDLIPASPAAVSNIPTAAQNADAVWDELLSGHAVGGSAGNALTEASAAGAGAILTTFTVTNVTSQPLDGVLVEISTDTAKTNVIARGYTISNGTVKLNLDPGTYYLWKNLAGYDFTNPESVTVS